MPCLVRHRAEVVRELRWKEVVAPPPVPLWRLHGNAGKRLRLGESLLILLIAGLFAYIGWKYFQRRRFLRDLRIARVTPEELKKMLDAGEEIQIVDLRHSIDFASDPETLPGALHFDPKEIDQHRELIARDRDVILYCT